MKLHRILILLKLLFLLGCVSHVQLKAKPLSETAFKEAITKGVTFLNNYDYGGKDDLSRARANFEIARDLDSESPLPLDGLACIAIRDNDLVFARFLLDKVLELDPNYGRAYSNLAYVEQLEGNDRKAEELLRKSVKLNSLDSNAVNNLGSLLFNNSSGVLKMRNEGRDLIFKAREIHKGDLGLIERNIEIIKKAIN